MIDGDTINGKKYRLEGVQAQRYQRKREQQELERINSRSEVVPVLSLRVGIIDKLKGKKDIYKHRVRGVGMSGADPVGQFIVETIALAPVGKFRIEQSIGGIESTLSQILKAVNNGH